MPQDAQRKAWNEAMRSAAGVSNLPISLQNKTRRSDRRKRRDKARTTNSSSFGLGGEHEEYRAAVWLDALEQVADDAEQQDNQEEEYNELEELDKKTSRKRGAQKAAPKKQKKTKAGQMPKRFKARSLASILLQEEAVRADGVAQRFVHAAAAVESNLPTRPYCPVTGLPGVYREPKLNLHYANDGALEQIRERAPPWRNLTGTAAYSDVVKSMQSAK